jgi:ADP-heptose:LPS heptosyltransferase
MSSSRPTQKRSVALIRLRVGLGDLLCTVPALRALRAHWPDAHIVLVTWGEMRPVVERYPALVDELMDFPGYPGIPERPPVEEDIEPFFAAAAERRFDLALQMYGANPAANEVTERMGARRTAGFFVTGATHPDLSTHLPYPHHEHEVDRHLALLRLLGIPSQGRELEFPLLRADVEEATAALAAAGVEPGRPYACLHPGATSQSRRWPVDRFAAVGDALAARGLQVAVTGVASEAELTGSVVAAMRAAAVDLAGATSLGGYAAVLRDAALLVCSDTGAAHMAAALRTPSVVIFQSGDPDRWTGYGPQHRVARVQVECNPCPHLVCPIDHRCAQRLPAELVLGEADAALAAARP